MTKPTVSLQELRAKIGHRAKSAPSHRFWGMFVHIAKLETLESAYLAAKSKDGAAGSDGETFESIEEAGRGSFLEKLATELRTGTYKPLPNRRKEIPKGDGSGKVRTLSIPAIRDRVVQGAIRLILEPIFEVDFSDSSFGARPGRNAHQALSKVCDGLRRRRLHIADVDLRRYFDCIRHDRIMAKVARRICDGDVLALIKKFLKTCGAQGVPQGSPLSPLLGNLALNDLDHALDRGANFLTYARYLDDMVVLAPDSEKGRKWVDRALNRIREEAADIGVSLNEDKTRTVTMTEPDATFAFLGFDLRWARSPRTGTWYARMTPQRKKVTSVLREVRDTLRKSRHLQDRDAVARINPIVRGWANYFREGTSTEALHRVRYEVELKVRHFAAKKRGRKGYGWKRWSNDVVYGRWGLYDDYAPAYLKRKRAPDVRNHKPEGMTPPRRAEYGKSVRSVRCGGGRKRSDGGTREAPSTERDGHR